MISILNNKELINLAILTPKSKSFSLNDTEYKRAEKVLSGRNTPQRAQQIKETRERMKNAIDIKVKF